MRDFTEEFPDATSSFPLGDLNPDGYCILNREKPPTYDNLWYAKQPFIQRPSVAFYDSTHSPTTLPAKTDFVISIWIITPQDPIEDKVRIDVRPSNMTKTFRCYLEFIVA